MHSFNRSTTKYHSSFQLFEKRTLSAFIHLDKKNIIINYSINTRIYIYIYIKEVERIINVN